MALFEYRPSTSASEAYSNRGSLPRLERASAAKPRRSVGGLGHHVRVSPMENGTQLSLTDVLRFNRRWTDADRAIIGHEINSTGSTAFTFRQSGFNEYVAATSSDGQSTLHISKGTIYFKAGYNPNRPEAVADGDHWILRLSTHQSVSDEPRREQAVGEVCARCFQTKSVTGICGNCD